MTLKELIDYLSACDPATKVPIGFARPHSYRGDYYDLAFEPVRDTTVGDMLAAAQHAMGKTYQGYKGGDYKMDEWTSCWLAEYGHGGGEVLGPVLLAYMTGKMADTPIPEGDRDWVSWDEED